MGWIFLIAAAYKKKKLKSLNSCTKRGKIPSYLLRNITLRLEMSPLHLVSGSAGTDRAPCAVPGPARADGNGKAAINNYSLAKIWMLGWCCAPAVQDLAIPLRIQP